MRIPETGILPAVRRRSSRSCRVATMALLLMSMLLCASCVPAAAAEGLPFPLQWLWPFGHRNKVLAHFAVRDDCRLHPEDFLDRADNSVVRVYDAAGAAHCGFAIGAGEQKFGKLIPPPFAASKDIWMRGRVFFPEDFRLPQTPVIQGRTCNMGVHLWRIYSNLDGALATVDFNIPAGMDRLQLFFISARETPGANLPAREVVQDLDYRPAADGLRGRWQLWELHLSLGRPGKPDGYLRFYADGKFVGSLEHKVFLPKGSGRERWIRYVDIQSNIGGAACGANSWPLSNQWLTDDISICRGRCPSGEEAK
ncbi:MAG: hypothetical protein P4M01_12495 [Acidobacteriota bacterium]|nr:hypothetical protein [Acidobacteriota bacterium]